MNRTVPVYSELYSISDLHLGGAQGTQMFCQGARLKAFIESLAKKQNEDGRTFALVIAGDIIDSLPYLTISGSYVAVDGAAHVVSMIMKDDSFKPVFDGLKTFLENDSCELILLIGNHDLELAFPEAQEELLQTIAPTDSARGRVRFFMQGTGFRCRVGNKNVFITHGNEADPWNHVDYEAIRKASHARSLGKTFDSDTWVPNAGTKLVVDVMNRIKSDYPFIDLLKPEVAAAVKVLSVLDPQGAINSFYDALPAFFRAAKKHIGPHVVLGEGGRLVEQEPEVVRLLGEAFRDATLSDSYSRGEIEQRVDQFQHKNLRPEDLVSDTNETLGYGKYVWNKLIGKSDPEALRKALKDWINGDQSYNLENRDNTFKGILAQVGTDIDVVITGHTHLPRWIAPIERGHLVYLNSGTWARLIGLREEFLENETAFTPIYNALISKNINDLDMVPKLILDATISAHVTADKAELVRIMGLENSLKEEPIEDLKQSLLEWEWEPKK
jgi:UDP-2,3-diacylglucosamine pyrophosphatase LpxH